LHRGPALIQPPAPLERGYRVARRWRRRRRWLGRPAHPCWLGPRWPVAPAGSARQECQTPLSGGFTLAFRHTSATRQTERSESSFAGQPLSPSCFHRVAWLGCALMIVGRVNLGLVALSTPNGSRWRSELAALGHRSSNERAVNRAHGPSNREMPYSSMPTKTKKGCFTQGCVRN
jgi:hypothetical protein